MRILCVGDIHLSDRPPASCTDEYLDDLFTILEHSVAKAIELKVDAVVWAGDVFHHKQPSRTSHKTVQRAIDLIKSYECPLLIVPGNHDMLGDRFESIHETQPLGVLLQAGAELLRGWHVDLPIYGVPWLQDWSYDEVSAALAEWRNAVDADLDLDALVIAHAPLFPPGLEGPYEHYPIESWTSAMDNRGFCYYGHVHDAHGIYEAYGVKFANMGAITRGSLQESDMRRVVRLALWDQAAGFTEIDIPHKPADQVFRLMERRAEQDAEAKAEEFLDSIVSTSLEITSTDSIMEHVGTQDVSERVKAVIKELILEAEK